MQSFLVIAAKDLKQEFRTKQMLNSMVFFALLVIIIFSFSFREIIYNTEKVTQLAPGMLWITFTFAGMLGISRSFASEIEDGCLDALRLLPIDRSSIYVGKVIANCLIMFTVEIVSIPAFIILFDYPLSGTNLVGLAIVAVLGTIGFISVGTLLSALTVNAKTREILLPVIIFPVILPMLADAVAVTGLILNGVSVFDAAAFVKIRLILMYDIVYFVAASMLFEYAIEG